MFKIGCHLSTSKGFLGMGKDAVSIGANTFQFFTRNPRGGSAKAIDKKDVADFLALARANDISSLVAHAPYTLNACAVDPHIRQFAESTMADDLQRMEYVPGNFYNFHPGSHVGQGVETGISLISGMLNRILKPEQTTTVLLETMAGKGSEIGGKFEELHTIIERVELDNLLGVCLDTCHVYDAGYDMVNRLDDVLEQFDKVIGLGRLRAIHLNDSIFGYESHKDRHAKIGEGKLGIEAITRIINHPSLRHLPFNLETPNELDGYAAEIKLLKGVYNEKTLNLRDQN
jgi:deoxyribonuclease-4